MTLILKIFISDGHTVEMDFWRRAARKPRIERIRNTEIRRMMHAERTIMDEIEHRRLKYVCIFGFKGASTSQVIGTRNEMMSDDNDGQMIFGELVGLKLPDIRLTGEEKPRKNLTQETCPDRGSNPDPLRDKHACYH